MKHLANPIMILSTIEKLVNPTFSSSTGAAAVVTSGSEASDSNDLGIRLPMKTPPFDIDDKGLDLSTPGSLGYWSPGLRIPENEQEQD